MKIARPNLKVSPAVARTGAFTLLELLVVITIIGVLAGLMFPAANGALRRAAKSHASNTAYNLKTAISAYYTEYRKYPAEGGGEGDQDFRTNNQLMDILLGADNEAEDGGLNPRRIVFYTGKEAKPKGDGTYIKGIVLTGGGSGELWDPWGEYYYVRLDTDYNSRVSRPEWDSTSAGSPEIPESILVWSEGADPTDHKGYVKTW